MQKYNETINNLAQNATTNPNQHMIDFNEEKLIRKFEKDIENKTFFKSYQMFYGLALTLAVIAQLASAYSSYSFFKEVAAIKIKDAIALEATTILVLIIVEVMKFYVFKTTLQKIFAIRREINLVLILLSIGISLVSAYASIVGGGHLGIDNRPVAVINENYSNELKEKQKQIDLINSTDNYKIIQWTGNGLTTKVLSQEGLALIKKKESELDNIRAKMLQETEKVEKENEINEIRYQIGFGVFELIFITCTYFIWYFKRNSVIEVAIKSGTIRSQFLLHQNTPTSYNTENNCSFDYSLKNQANNQAHNTGIGFQVGKPKDITGINNPPLKQKEKATLKQVQSNFEVAFKRVNTKKNKQPHQPTEQIQEVEKKIEATVKALEVKGKKWLQKYEPAVKLLLLRESEGVNDCEIKEELMNRFLFSEGTYYNIKRIVNNTETK